MFLYFSTAWVHLSILLSWANNLNKPLRLFIFLSSSQFWGRQFWKLLEVCRRSNKISIFLWNPKWILTYKHRKRLLISILDIKSQGVMLCMSRLYFEENTLLDYPSPWGVTIKIYKTKGISTKSPCSAFDGLPHIYLYIF